MIFLLVLFSLLGIGLILVIYGTVAENRWGINLGSVSCPSCKAPLPQVRTPRSFRETLWGGYTCATCGAEVDKWGRQINQATHLSGRVLAPESGAETGETGGGRSNRG